MYTSYFLFNDTATTGIDTYGHTLSLPDALPICPGRSDLIPVINAAGIRLPAWRILGELGLRIRSALSAGVRALPSIKARRAVVAVPARAPGAAGSPTGRSIHPASASAADAGDERTEELHVGEGGWRPFKLRRAPY